MPPLMYEMQSNIPWASSAVNKADDGSQILFYFHDSLNCRYPSVIRIYIEIRYHLIAQRINSVIIMQL